MVKDKTNLLWNYAKKIIPAGNSLISKRPDLFSPKHWPTYFEKANGHYIWGIDGKKYQDFSLMGIGTNVLGYANKKIDNEIIKKIKKSNVSTLNCVEEINLAKKLIEIHPWAKMAKFARTGGEASTIAIRIARSYSKNENIAICGYHGWHDWYQAANIKKNILDKHLIKGVSSSGVCKKLKNSIYSFEYNKIDQLKKLLKKKIGIVIMEVRRNAEPKNNFLHKIRKICSKNKIILIFDECTSGFRETFGGLHLKYKVNPDICIFGKALGNGYAITAVIGKKNIMNKAKNSFISSTFWTERIGYVAALKTIEVMKKTNSFIYVKKIGKFVKKKWGQIAKSNNLSINIYGLDSMPSFNFNSKKHLIYKSYLTREMLKNNILATNSIYISTSHNHKNLRKYFFVLNKIFKEIYKDEIGIKKLKLKNNEICKTTFKRLN